jgi:hypothetical protein
MGQLYRVRTYVARLVELADLRRLSEAENVVLIGHGAGCAPLMDLVNTRGGCPSTPRSAEIGG